MMMREEVGVVGVLPSSGWGTRLSGTPVSKELLPAWRPAGSTEESLPLPACRCCLDAFRAGGVESVLVPIRAEKWDLVRYLEQGEGIPARIALVPTGVTRGPAESVAHALAFAGGSVIAFGFPDIIFQASNPFGRMLERLDRKEVDGVLGLFPHPPERRADSVSMSPEGQVTEITGGVRSDGTGWSWALAVWKRNVSDCLLRYVSASGSLSYGEAVVDDPGFTLGAIFRAALDEGLRLDGLALSDTSFVDVGEPRGWAAAVRTPSGAEDRK